MCDFSEARAVRSPEFVLATSVMTPTSSTRSLILDLPPSCIAFCPTQPHLFVVGTYYLHDSTTTKTETSSSAAGSHQISDHQDDTSNPSQTRSGSLIVYELNDDEM